MIFRQLFDATSSTYTCLLAIRRGGEALIIAPVPERVARYRKLIEELDLKLVKAVDTHPHADHITGPGALHAPYPNLRENIGAGGVLHERASATGKRLVFFCACGERSAMAVQAAQDAGLGNACHTEGGMGAWKKAGGALA